jgi:hypothetical protein
MKSKKNFDETDIAELDSWVSYGSLDVKKSWCRIRKGLIPRPIKKEHLNNSNNGSKKGAKNHS